MTHTHNTETLAALLPSDGCRKFERILRRRNSSPCWFYVYIENWHGRYYLSFGRSGCALAECVGKRVRKSMTLAAVFAYVDEIAGANL